MFNMIKFDWLGMKCYHKRIVILPLIICIYGLFNEGFIVPIIALMMLSFSVNPFAVEEKGKLDNLYLTLPVIRNDIVKARFGLSFIMQLVGLVVGGTITVILSALLYGKTVFVPHFFKADFNNMLIIICCSLFFYAIMNLSTFPILFKIGYAKGKGLGFYIPLSAVGVLIVVVYLLWYFSDTFQTWLFQMFEWVYANMVLSSLLLLAVAVILLTISYLLSCKFYAKRDF